jgi:hypothetical protein
VPVVSLGSSGIQVSRLALGSWRTYERISRDQGIRIMQAAREAGINFPYSLVSRGIVEDPGMRRLASAASSPPSACSADGQPQGKAAPCFRGPGRMIKYGTPRSAHQPA